MNASSESGLCATEISRTGADTVLIRFLNPVLSTSLLENIRRNAACRRLLPRGKTGPAPSLHGSLLVPAGGDGGSHQHLDNFRKNEPVESVAERQRNRVREHGKPAESTREEHQFRSHG